MAACYVQRLLHNWKQCRPELLNLHVTSKLHADVFLLVELHIQFHLPSEAVQLRLDTTDAEALERELPISVERDGKVISFLGFAHEHARKVVVVSVVGDGLQLLLQRFYLVFGHDKYPPVPKVLERFVLSTYRVHLFL